MNDNKLSKIGFGGGCHWCAEAVFQSLQGVDHVEQGFVASFGDNDTFSEAVIVHFDEEIVLVKELVEIHLCTHKSTSDHSMREKYRSAIYTYYQEQFSQMEMILLEFQKDFDQELITKVYPFRKFKASRAQITNYYFCNPEKPFCESFINPKLELLLKRFPKRVNAQKLNHLVTRD